MAEEQISSMTQQELLARVRNERATFAALWDGLSEAQMTQRPGPQDDWSVKDLIMHIVWWEQYLLVHLTEVLAGETIGGADDFDKINAYIFEHNKDLPLSAALAAFAATLPQLEAQIAAFNDEEISMARPGSHSVLTWFKFETFGHYPNHSGDLQKYVTSLKSGAP